MSDGIVNAPTSAVFGLLAAAGLGYALSRARVQRGERVHLAMLARGWTGTMPTLATTVPAGQQWALGLLPVAVALALVIGAWGAA